MSDESTNMSGRKQEVNMTDYCPHECTGKKYLYLSVQKDGSYISKASCEMGPQFPSINDLGKLAQCDGCEFRAYIPDEIGSEDSKDILNYNREMCMADEQSVDNVYSYLFGLSDSELAKEMHEKACRFLISE